MQWIWLPPAFILSSLSIYQFCRANYCACTLAGQCNNPVGCHWLLALLAALFSLLFCAASTDSATGSLVWSLMMGGQLGGALLAGKKRQLRRCKASTLKDAGVLLTDGIS